MNKIKIDIYQGFLLPLTVAPPECMDLLRQLMIDLTGVKIKFPLGPDLTVTVKVTRQKNLKKDQRNLWKLFKRYIRTEIFLTFSATIYFKDQDYPDMSSETLSSNDIHANYMLIPHFEKRYYDFLIALDIARPGAVHHGQALLFANNKFVKRLKSMSLHSSEILEHALKSKWPVLESLDILKTWDWYLSRAFPLELDELSVDSLSRSINAFSHLYSSNSGEIELLFWAMVGIESLYVNGKENITDQVKRKVPLVLGEIKEHKNRLSKMYGYRSGFFHGVQNFPNYFHIHDGLDSHDKFIRDYADALYTAMSILVATLQQMAKYNLDGLRFEHAWINCPDE